MIPSRKLLWEYGNNMDQDCVLRPVIFSVVRCVSDASHFLSMAAPGPRRGMPFPWGASSLIQFSVYRDTF